MVQTRAQLRRAGQGQQPADAADFESQHAQTKAEQVAQGTPKQAAGMTDQHAAQAMSVPSVLAGLQTGMQVPRSRTAYLQQTYLNQQLKAMDMKPLTGAQRAVADKAFCSVWLDNSTVLVGTKCNSLLLLHLHNRSHALLQYPPQPPHRLGPDLLAAPAAIHCGQHALAVSPGRQWLVTGGKAPQDILLWQLGQEDYYPLERRQQQGLPLDTPAGRRSSAASRTVLRPVQTLMGHADWVFDMAWLDDNKFVSAGRDRTIKLWQVPQQAAAAAGGAGVVPYTTEPAACQTSLQHHKDKVRSIRYDQQQQMVASLCVDGCVGFWTPELQWCGGCKLPHDVDSPQTLLLHGNLTAVGYLQGTLLIDSRVSKPVASIAVDTSAKRQRVEGQQSAAAAAAAVPGIQLSSTELLVQQQMQELVQLQAQQQRQQRQQQQQQNSAANSDADSEGDWEHEGYSDDEHNSADSDAEFEGDGQQGGYSDDEQQQQQQQQQEPVDQARLEQLSEPALMRGLVRALAAHQQDVQQQIRQLLPAEVYYAVQRYFEATQRQLTASIPDGDNVQQHMQRHGGKRLRPVGGRGQPAAVQADLTGAIAVGESGVRSLSLQHHLLGIGTGDGQLLFHDMRRLSSQGDAAAAVRRAGCTPVSVGSAGGNFSSSVAEYDRSWVQESSGSLPARVGCMGLPDLGNTRHNEVLGVYGFAGDNYSDLAVYTHCWDATGTQLFAAGGPLLLGYKGCAFALYS